MAEQYGAEGKNADRSQAEHTLWLSGRSAGTVTGVTDVIAFDEKEIQLKTKAGKMTIKGSGLSLTRLNLEKGETDIQGKTDGVLYSRDLPQKRSGLKSAIRRWV